jgi:hypothetical protein
MTVERAKSSEIGFVYSNHENIFKANEDRDFLILLVYVMHEYQKGKESFWHPYFNALDPTDLACYWDASYI